MKISERSIQVLARAITGDSGMSPYRSGPNLVRFFNQLGSNDVYAFGFPTRWYYSERKLRELNDTLKMAEGRDPLMKLLTAEALPYQKLTE